MQNVRQTARLLFVASKDSLAIVGSTCPAYWLRLFEWEKRHLLALQPIRHRHDSFSSHMLLVKLRDSEKAWKGAMQQCF
jgi:hypothetical protein